MIDTTKEKLLPLKDVCCLVPPARTGKKTHLSTVLRWILTGAKDRRGNLVRLEGLRVGGRWMVSREALQRFFETLSLFPEADVPRQQVLTTKQHRTAGERAASELEQVGI